MSVEAPSQPPLGTSAASRFPDRIWLGVLGALQRTPPRPDGKGERSAIRQPELASMMRVSKRLNRLISTVLYRTVITDNLALLTYNIARPAAARGVPSKDELLVGIDRLFIEYSDKRRPGYRTLLADGGAYWDVVHCPNEMLGRFELFPLCEEEANRNANAFAALHKLHDEVQAASATGAGRGAGSINWHIMKLEDEENWGQICADRVAALAGGDRRGCKRPAHTRTDAGQVRGLGLRAMALGAILGGQNEIWEGVWRGGKSDGLWGRVVECRGKLVMFLAHLNLQMGGRSDLPTSTSGDQRQHRVAFCQRGVYGPLSFPVQMILDKNCSLGIAVHIDGSVVQAPVITGPDKLNRTTWFLERIDRGREVGVRNPTVARPQSTGLSSLRIIRDLAQQLFTDSSTSRAALYYQRYVRPAGNAPPPPPIPTRVAVYIRSLPELGPMLARKCIAEINATLDAKAAVTVVRGSGNKASNDDAARGADGLKGDEWSWEAMRKAPDCEACGWSAMMAGR